MRNFLIIAFLGGLVAGGLQADEKSQIAQIRKWYGEIEGDKSLKKTSYKWGEEPHTATLTRYVSQTGELKKLVLEAGGEHGHGSTSYYFDKGRLFFVYDASESWYITGGNEDGTKTETTDIGRQYRYYFHEGKCIRALAKTVQTKDASKLRELMKKAENEPMVHHDTAPKVLEKALALSKVTSAEALERYFSRP
jgi:hypothetical protein